MPVDKSISGLIASQLPDFINAKYQEGAPSFRRFIELYYEWLESEGGGNTVYHIVNSEKYRDIDNTQDAFLTYFKKELLPFFPERTELELTKILKGAKEFYLKKGTEDSIKWLFRVLFNKEVNVFYPKDDILRASDGKWQLPKSIKVSDSPLVIQIASSVKNITAQNVNLTGSHSNSIFYMTADFSNNLRKNSTLVGFASYKIIVDSAISASTLYTNLTNYVSGNNVIGTMTDSSGESFVPFLTTPLISTNRTGYGKNLFVVTEGFYTQNVTSDATTVSYQSNLPKKTIASVLGLPAANVTIKNDGVRVFELGNIEKDSLISSNGLFEYSTTSADVLLSVDSANTPAYVFSFAKEERGTVLNVDTANNSAIANGTFGDDRYVLQYQKEFAEGNTLSLFSSSSAANVSMIGFSFRERPKVDIKLLEKKKVIGLVSNATATVEKVFVKIDEFTKSQYTELFLSNILGEFQNNELIEVEYLDNEITKVFTERIFGFVGSVTVDPHRRGLNYQVGDPVVIYGGNSGGDETSSAGFLRASAIVSNVTSGRILSGTVVKGGYGYRTYSNTLITVVNDPSDTTGSGAEIRVGGVNTAANITLTLANDTIQAYATVALSNTTYQFPKFPAGNIASTLTSCLGFQNIDFYPISSIVIVDGGSGYTTPPSLSFNTVYQIDGTSNVSISSLGMIANVEVVFGGSNYNSGDTVIFSGGGLGAAATLSVSGGVVTGVTVTNRGFGYSEPSVSISSGTGSGAILRAYGFSDGAEVSLTVDDVGRIDSIQMQNLGFGYTSTPKASLKVIDLYLTGLTGPVQSDTDLVAYQGASLAAATFTGNVDANFAATSTATITGNNTLRVYDYNGSLGIGSPVIINGTGISANLINYRVYGNSLAKANVNFVDGTVSYPGYFLNTDGFLSADKKIQDGTKYHSYSYVIESEKQLKEYKQTLMNVLHPAGMRMISHTKIVDTDEKREQATMNTFAIYRNTGNINAGPMLFTSYYAGSNANVSLGHANTANITSNSVSTTNFSTLGPSGGSIAAGDRIILNYANTYRSITLTVQSVASSTRLNTSGPVVLSGFGTLALNSSSIYATCSVNVAGKIVANDYVRIFDKFDFDVTGNDNHVIVRRVANTPSNNIIELSSAPPISNSGLGYWVDPDFRNVPFRVERTI